MLQIEYIWKSALLVLEANILHLYIIIYMHFIRNIYIYIWKPALLVVYKYIYIYDTGSTCNTRILFGTYIYIYSKHVSKLTSFIFYLYDILSAGGNYFFIYIKYSICILITGTYSMCHKFSIGLFRVGWFRVGLGFRV